MAIIDFKAELERQIGIAEEHSSHAERIIALEAEIEQLRDTLGRVRPHISNHASSRCEKCRRLMIAIDTAGGK